jgi:hypothetical protein
MTPPMTERRSETADGVEVLVSGDASRDALAQRALTRGPALTERALGFLRGWLHDGFAPERGSFELVTLEVPAAFEPGGGDVVLQFVFTLDAAPEEYGYTWFEVVLNERDHPPDPFWPVGVRVGFW